MLGNSGKLQDAHLRVVFVKRNVTARSWFDSMFTLVSGGMDCLDPEHIFYGAEALKLCMVEEAF